MERRICLADRRGVMSGWVGKVFCVLCVAVGFTCHFTPLYVWRVWDGLVQFAAMLHSLLVGGLMWSDHRIRNGDLGGVLGKGQNSACQERFEHGVYNLK